MSLSSQTGPGPALNRIGAMVMRYWYLLRSSWPRLLELVYWPTVNLLTWGFLQTHMLKATSGAVQVAGALISAMLLWDILMRGQLGFSISFLEEMWSRNLGNLMMSPLRPWEFVAALMIMSLVRLFIGLVPVTFMAMAFFGFNVYGLGLGLGVMFANLILTSWSVALLVAGLVLRYGLGAETLAWTIMFLIWPLSCVYYPVSTLPPWLQGVAWALPPTHVFEGMRGVLVDHALRLDLMAGAFALNIVWAALGFAAFTFLLESARRRGSLLSTGE